MMAEGDMVYDYDRAPPTPYLPRYVDIYGI